MFSMEASTIGEAPLSRDEAGAVDRTSGDCNWAASSSCRCAWKSD
jgi:hypothetical protein